LVLAADEDERDVARVEREQGDAGASVQAGAVKERDNQNGGGEQQRQVDAGDVMADADVWVPITRFGTVSRRRNGEPVSSD
jgi:hypothetical protein